MLKSSAILLLASTIWGADAKPKDRAAGFEVETIRIATQPFPKYTSGMTRAAAVALLMKLNELSVNLGFSGSTGKKAGDRTEFEDTGMANTILQGLK